MPRILVIENDNAWIAELEKILTDVFRESSHVKSIGLAEEAQRAISSDRFFDDVDLVLVDLELGPGTGRSPGDYLGRDVVLKEIRTHACWVPVILVSRYITGDLAILAEITPYDFDAAVAKEFFTDPKSNRKQWAELRLRAATKRVAALTGRSTHELEELLKQKLVLDFGAGVAEEIEHYGSREFEALLKLVNLGSPRVVLDEVVLGYSGLTVLKATCRKGNDLTRWLLKFGTAIQKLDRELRAHRRMFEDGFTRLMSVPVFWWRPVVWNSLGMIAYEFQEGTATLLARIREQGAQNGLRAVAPALQELYRGVEPDNVIPRNCLRRLVKRLRKEKDTGRWGRMVSALLQDERHERLDKSVRVLVGSEHGDLHARNILLCKRGPVLIDFAHFLGRQDTEIGVPLLDLAKLCVDLSIWKAANLSFADLLSGAALDSDILEDVVRFYMVDQRRQASPDERRLFGCAAGCFLALYSVYKDVPEATREAVRTALSAAE